MINKTQLISTGTTAIIGLTLFLLLNPVVIIDTGHRGIRVRYGQVIGEALEEGIKFKTPFVDTIIEFDTRTRKTEESSSTYTKDVQQVDIGYVLQYNLKRTAVGEVYREVGTEYETILLAPALNGAIKEAVGKWDAVDLVENRDKAADQILEKLKIDLDPKGITISGFEITNLKFDAQFEEAVEKKVTAVQRAEEAKNKTVQVQEEANQKIIAAKAEAEAMRIKTQALAASPTLVQYEAVQKWDGHLPQQMVPGGAVPFINLKQ